MFTTRTILDEERTDKITNRLSQKRIVVQQKYSRPDYLYH